LKIIAIIGSVTALPYTVVIFQWRGCRIEKSYASVLVKIFHLLLREHRTAKQH